jgi:cell division protein FtsW (lipid II flippase)
VAVTRSTAADRDRRGTAVQLRVARARTGEFFALVAAIALAIAALVLAYRGRTARLPAPTQAPLNLSTVEKREQLLPYLTTIAAPAERQYIARKVFEYVRDLQDGGVPNVGVLARIRVPIREVTATRGLTSLQARARELLASNKDATTVALLTGAEFSHLKPSFVVRDLERFKSRLWIWTPVFVLMFFAVHLFWTVRGFRGSSFVLPALALLSGIGLVLMISLRDPLRDTLMFVEFIQGVALGCIVLAIASVLDYRRLTGRLSYVFLLAGFVLSAALIIFGTGPGGSDAKVNLLGFQPAEIVRLCIVFFLAGYFADRWEFLRTLREQRTELASVSKWVEVPRLEYLLPVLAGVIASLAFFFLQKDLGPALLIACMFLAMYAVARDRYLFATAGMALILGGFIGGYLLGFTRTVSQRVSMWLSPWDNAVRGGEQVVHALWGFATGGLTGTGLGLGDPELMPAAHTDLILAVLGEEWGFIGVVVVLLLYSLLVWFGFRTALRARSDYSFFLALGLSLTVALQVALIAGGVLDILPLSGVVMPFLSYGRTALITNFAIFGMLIALAKEGSPREESTVPFRSGARAIGILLAAFAGVLLVKAAYVQIVRADPTLGRGALTMQADGFRRFQYNPRLLAIARTIPRGAIYDRNGLPLATSDWEEVAKNRDAYAKAGITIPTEQPPLETRFYPLGARAVHLLGDLRSRANWGARNSSYAERDFSVALQGYDDRATVVTVPDPRTGKPTYTVRYDFRELVPLLRHRYEPNNPVVRKIRDRDRTLHMSIDARLQVKAADLLEAQLKKLRKTKGSVVVLDPASGDLLAAVSAPVPAQMPPHLSAADEDDAMLDRARYGLYPPGSSFKVVTAMAALRRDPKSVDQQYECKRLPDGRVGNYIKGWNRPIRDDVKDAAPHGVIAMRQGMIVSCNAYFAQLGTYRVGAEALLETANLLGVSIANPSNAKTVRSDLPQVSYGQGQVVVSPFQMARVAATIAASGSMPYGRWVTDQNNPRQQPAQAVLTPDLAGVIGGFMRGVVTSGTGRSAATSAVEIAGKTGTAELEHAPSHAWFIGYAPYGGKRPLAFAVLIENGQYGGTAAAPLAADVMTAAKQLGLFERVE